LATGAFDSPRGGVAVIESMATRAKLIASVLSNAKNVRYADACKIAEWLGLVAKGQKGDHNAFARPGEVELLNFQDRGGMIKPYQARQLQKMIEKYWFSGGSDVESDA
jgi:hypothetical protein